MNKVKYLHNKYTYTTRYRNKKFKRNKNYKDYDDLPFKSSMKNKTSEYYHRTSIDL